MAFDEALAAGADPECGQALGEAAGRLRSALSGQGQSGREAAAASRLRRPRLEAREAAAAAAAHASGSMPQGLWRVDEIAREIAGREGEGLKLEGEGEIRFELSLGRLGGLGVVIVRDETGGVGVTLSTSNPEAGELVEGHAHELVKRLEGRGVRVAEVRVVSGAGEEHRGH